MDTTGNILKYRFKHLVKADVEFKIFKVTLGVSYKYYSKMQNIDKAFQDIETTTANIDFIDDIRVTNYWKTHKGFNIWDGRIGCQVNTKTKLSIICSNLFNVDYSLRPLKIESPRTTAVQYVYTF